MHHKLYDLLTSFFISLSIKIICGQTHIFKSTVPLIYGYLTLYRSGFRWDFIKCNLINQHIFPSKKISVIFKFINFIESGEYTRNWARTKPSSLNTTSVYVCGITHISISPSHRFVWLIFRICKSSPRKFISTEVANRKFSISIWIRNLFSWFACIAKASPVLGKKCHSNVIRYTVFEFALILYFLLQILVGRTRFSVGYMIRIFFMRKIYTEALRIQQNKLGWFQK